jgi:GNAT superfamily N-acetyltransferase
MLARSRHFPVHFVLRLAADGFVLFYDSVSESSRSSARDLPGRGSVVGADFLEVLIAFIKDLPCEPPNGGVLAEFAIMVRSRLKGHGVGWLLMKHMIAFSKHKNLRTVRGQVLSENTTMLAMCAELGFHITDDPDGHGVKTVTLPVR